jgi:hypothetical protein
MDSMGSTLIISQRFQVPLLYGNAKVHSDNHPVESSPGRRASSLRVLS